MTTELTLREKAESAVFTKDRLGRTATPSLVIDRIADLLSATGAPAYCRVADDLRGVVREEGVVTATSAPNFVRWGCQDFGTLRIPDVYEAFGPERSDPHPARYLGQFDKRGGK